jgi:isoaspartyl peptidase/L-asparaginase-like protein (Ntn-hydrolase superfamily)
MARPVIVATWKFGRIAVEAGWKVLARGGRALDAVEAGACAVEDDPSVDSVGTGGLPNRDGVVELDASIMDGETLRFGAVAGLCNIRHPTSVARRVMEETPHLMLVGEGAYRFARKKGFRRANLLTPKARKTFRTRRRELGPDWHDTIGVVAMDAKGRLAGACSTSGMPWSFPGRVGDSPIIGSGLYVDRRIGAVVGTGVGEEIMRVTGAAVIAEELRRKTEPAKAIRAACRRIAERVRRQRHPHGAGFLVIDRRGRVAAGSVHRRYMPYAVGAKRGVKMEMAPGILPPRKKRKR